MPTEVAKCHRLLKAEATKSMFAKLRPLQGLVGMSMDKTEINIIGNV